MSKISREERQQIILDFAKKHGGKYDARGFVEVVEKEGETHPAHGYFEWDNQKAASEYRIWQAREFAQGLKIVFTRQEIVYGQVVTREAKMPLAVSPVATRYNGGGYYVSDPSNPDHMEEFCRQASADLSRWLRRYSAALLWAGGSEDEIARQVQILEAALTQSDPDETVETRLDRTRLDETRRD